MIQFLLRLITPIAESMGAEASMVESVLKQCATQVNVICWGLVALVVFLVACHWLMKKGNRAPVRWTAVIAWVLVVLMMGNQIVYGPMYTLLDTFLSSSKAELAEETVEGSYQVIEEVGKEGLVLLKNDGLLPLDTSVSKLNVFGWTSTNTVFSGTGSSAAGELNANPVSILDSLHAAGYETNEELSDMYVAYREDRPAITMNNQDWTLPEPTMDHYTDAIMGNAKAFSDTAVIVVGRSGGENADLPADMNAVIHGTYDISTNDVYVMSDAVNQYGYFKGHYTNNGDYDDFEPGEHYLELSVTEEKLVDLVASNFENVILVVNANNTMELGWINDYPQIRGVILAPGTGASGMTALGQILNGSVNPSGKTVDTYLYDLKAAPTWNNAGNAVPEIYSNYTDLSKKTRREDVSYLGTASYVFYNEGIYQGYKFYETAAAEKLIDYDQVVQFPFGYGLSYTTFEQTMSEAERTDTAVTVSVTVKNTGSVPGKDVVELYVTAPYTNGGIEKSAVNLVDFGKTRMLAPGEEETLSFTLPLEDMASFDSSEVKVAGGGYILEAGEYTLSARSSSHTVLDEKSFTLDSDIVYSEGRPSDHTVATNQFDYAAPKQEVLSRKDGFANYEAAIAAPSAETLTLSKDETKAIQAISISRYKPEDHDEPDAVMPTTGASNGLKLADLTGKSYNDPMWDQLLDQMTVEDMVTLVSNGGWATAQIDSVGKVRTSECDGPAGLSNYLTGSMGTQFPTEVLMAQTWSPRIAELVGEAMGAEFAAAENFGWYGPAVNIHRFAFGGRNYEYYSEDPVLSGKFASAQVNAASRQGVYAYLKHFAVNDQETNRCAFLTSYLTEQTLRESVLKPFEIVVKNFDFDNCVMGMMSSYTWLGTVPCVSNPQLLTTVLRDEWGFTGAVISDFDGGYGYMLTDAAVRAGNDLMLATITPATGTVDTGSATMVNSLRRACKNILYVVGNSGYYKDFSNLEEAETPETALVEAGTSVRKVDQIMRSVNVAVVVACVVLLVLAWGLWFLRKKKRTAKA